MNEEKPGIGRPSKYLVYLAKLEDDELYTPSGIATLFHEWVGFGKFQVRKAMIKRATYHQMQPDGYVPTPFGQAPAYSGRQWKSTLDTVRLSEAPDECQGMEPLLSSDSVKKKGKPVGGGFLRYDHFIRHLDPFTLYGPQKVVAHGLKKDLFSHSDPKRLTEEMAKVTKSIRNYCSRLPETPDRSAVEVNGNAEKAWYGWRWQMALPDEALSPELKLALQGKVRRRRALTSTKAVGLYLLFLAFLGLTFAVGPNHLAKGLQILGDQGPRAAYAFFENLPQKTKEDRFGRAWSAFRDGQLQEARGETLGLLKEVSPDSKLAGDCYYLLGNIEKQRGDYQEALNALLSAEAIYLGRNSEASLHLTYCCLGRLFLEQVYALDDLGRIDEAIFYFQKASESKHLSGDYFSFGTRIEFELGDFENALEFSKQAIQSYSGNANLEGQARADFGFYSMLLGHFEEGLEETYRSEEMAVRTGDVQQYYYGLINKILYLKCQGQPYGVFLSMAQKYYDESRDKGFERFLNFVQQTECPELAPGAGSPSPPPPNDTGSGGNDNPDPNQGG